MKIPKMYENKVYSLKYDFTSIGYEVNLAGGYEYKGSGLHYVKTYREALEVMREAKKVD